MENIDLNGKVLGAFSDISSSLSSFSSLKSINQPFVILDILIVGVIFYFFYEFLRQTRALRILYGIIMLSVVWFIGQALDLTLLNTLLKYAFTSILVTIPIVFQPELRSALERLGRTTKFVTDFNRLSKNDIEDIVAEILKSVAALSKNKYGALIILTRSSGLREYSENGQLIYANLNHKLLTNIFTPKAPLHDGAVIISGHKIIAASVTLPILEDVYDLSLGTRHKAALSLSMQTDAIGLIVSEETGIISVAVDGRLQRNLNMDDLKEQLIKQLTTNRLKFKKKS